MSPDRKPCLQLSYPELQTPCFKAAGGTACEEKSCRVMQYVALMVAMTGEKVTQAELRQLFHDVCVLSMFSDNPEFWKRIAAMQFEE